MRAFHALTALAAPLGLRAQPVKCAVYSEDTAAAASVAAAMGMHHAPEGLLAAGTPVGTTAFEAASAATCDDKACTLMDRMQALPLADQITLPLRHGSLGLSCTSPALGRAAYLAASAAAHIAMRGGPEAFRPLDGPSGGVLRPQWEALHSEAGDLWKPELKEVNPERLGHIAEAQGVFAWH
jgi:hypothetical protein